MRFGGRPGAPKWRKNRYNIMFEFKWFFIPISESLFLDLGTILAPKTFQNERSCGWFFDLFVNMRKVWFWTTVQRFCYIFQLWKHQFSILKAIFFSCFFKGGLKADFYGFWIEIWSKLEAKWHLKSINELIWKWIEFLNDFLMDFGSPRGVRPCSEQLVRLGGSPKKQSQTSNSQPPTSNPQPPTSNFQPTTSNFNLELGTS